MNIRFEWDPAKAASNIRKHGISFDEAVTVFKDPLAFIFDDTAHSEQEHREIIIGASTLRRMILVCFMERLEDIVRIISARPATRQEIYDYEENAHNQTP
ncbi:MAG: BrnT family toxin [Anaerolineales bacterium]